MKQQRHNTTAAATTQNKKLIFTMTFFLTSFLVASYFGSFDNHIKNCMKTGNTYNYCESIYRG